MEQKSPDSNDSTFELSVQLRLKGQSKLGLKKSWILTIVLALIQVALKIWLAHH